MQVALLKDERIKDLTAQIALLQRTAGPSSSSAAHFGSGGFGGSGTSGTGTGSMLDPGAQAQALSRLVASCNELRNTNEMQVAELSAAAAERRRLEAAASRAKSRNEELEQALAAAQVGHALL